MDCPHQRFDDDKTLAHLLKYDSVHEKFEDPKAVDGGIKVGDAIMTSAIKI